jgi:hypothetical protein
MSLQSVDDIYSVFAASSSASFSASFSASSSASSVSPATVSASSLSQKSTPKNKFVEDNAASRAVSMKRREMPINIINMK